MSPGHVIITHFCKCGWTAASGRNLCEVTPMGRRQYIGAARALSCDAAQLRGWGVTGAWWANLQHLFLPDQLSTSLGLEWGCVHRKKGPCVLWGLRLKGWSVGIFQGRGETSPPGRGDSPLEGGPSLLPSDSWWSVVWCPEGGTSVIESLVLAQEYLRAQGQ